MGKTKVVLITEKYSDQVPRLPAIAAVLDGPSRAEAARVGGMDRQTQP
jgi:hypothetical protein